MSSSVALRKLKREYASLTSDPPSPGILVRPLESNFLHAHFLLYGEVLHDTPYEGGVYHGLLKFPREYPFQPPSIMMRTPSGRFKLNERICFSMSDFHPECWQPSWTTRTILNGFVSFMNGDEITTGGIDAPKLARVEVAKRTLEDCMTRDELATKIFGDVLDELKTEREGCEGWPPPRPPPTITKAPEDGGDKTKRRSTGKRGSAKNAPPSNQPKEEPKQQPQPPPSEGNDSGKNAAKNKKKREKEKRKKIATKLLTELRNDVPAFVNDVVNELQSRFGVDASHMNADHVCYRTDSMEQYERLIDALRSTTSEFELLIESEVGGRSIATFKLTRPIEGTDGGSVGSSHLRAIDCLEIPAPKDGRPYKAGLEHVEFVIAPLSSDSSTGADAEEEGGETTAQRAAAITSPTNSEAHQREFQKFMEAHSLPGGERWDTKAMDKESNPDVSLRFDLGERGTVSAKFHLMALEDVIRVEKGEGLNVKG